MKLTETIAGVAVEFECEDTFASRWVSADILAGRTYPNLEFVSPVDVIVDVGANCGATTVFLAHHHPNAIVHAVEPGSRQRAILERNVEHLPNVRVHPIGLDAENRTAQLHLGRDSGSSSIVRGWWHGDEVESIDLRAASSWLRAEGIERIDILKIDAEGCEVAIVESLLAWLPEVKVLYVEYDSRQARRDLDRLVAPTHELLLGKMLLDQGECLYLACDHADLPAATDWLRLVVGAAARAGGAVR